MLLRAQLAHAVPLAWVMFFARSCRRAYWETEAIIHLVRVEMGEKPAGCWHEV